MKNWQLKFHLGFSVSWRVRVVKLWEPMLISQYGLLFPEQKQTEDTCGTRRSDARRGLPRAEAGSKLMLLSVLDSRGRCPRAPSACGLRVPRADSAITREWPCGLQCPDRSPQAWASIGATCFVLSPLRSTEGGGPGAQWESRDNNIGPITILVALEI